MEFAKEKVKQKFLEEQLKYYYNAWLEKDKYYLAKALKWHKENKYNLTPHTTERELENAKVKLLIQLIKDKFFEK